MLDSPDKLTIGVTGVNAGVQNGGNKRELDGAVLRSEQKLWLLLPVQSAADAASSALL